MMLEVGGPYNNKDDTVQSVLYYLNYLLSSLNRSAFMKDTSI